MTLRELLKRGGERVLVHGGVARRIRRAHRGHHLILAYHNVVPDEDARLRPDPLHLSISRFRRHLDLLGSLADVVPLEGVGAGSGGPDPSGGGTRPSVSLTFDDGYRGMLELAVPELVTRGYPATVFVCPGLLSDPYFWWDAVDFAGEGERVFQELEGRQGAVLAWASDTGRRRPPPSPWRSPGSLDVLRGAMEVADGLLAAGAHGWDHPNLAALEGPELEEQLRSPLAWIEETLNPTTRWMAYPYGLSSPEVREAVGRVGYRGGLDIEGGWVPLEGQDRWRTPRISIPAGLSDEGFILRVSGVIRR
jgi:peptidoglycan/xylan/chitin deacetylase (PgdA/CDA1 family)